MLSILDIDGCCEGDVHVLNGIDCSYEGNEFVVSYDCSNRGMYKCCDLISLMDLLRSVYRGLVLIDSMKRERATALAFIVPVKDLCIIKCNTCVLVVIFFINVVCKSITVILNIYIYIYTRIYIYSLQPQRILLISSTRATCFDCIDRLQTLKT